MKDYILPEAAERWFAETIGDLFSLTAKQGYDSEQVVKTMLTVGLWPKMLLSEHLHFYCTGLLYTLDYFVKDGNIIKGNHYDSYVMWMYGYMLKWWMYKYPEDLSFVSKCFPISKFDGGFGCYHSQGWNYLVDLAHSFVTG